MFIELRPLDTNADTILKLKQSLHSLPIPTNNIRELSQYKTIFVLNNSLPFRGPVGIIHIHHNTPTNLTRVTCLNILILTIGKHGLATATQV